MSFWSWTFALLLMVGVPLQVRRSMAVISGLPRSAIYLNSSITLWVLAALAWGVVRLDGDRLADVNVRSVPAPGTAGLVAWTLALTLAGLALFAVSLAAEGMRGWPRETMSLEHLRPRTRSERVLALLVLSPSAGLCEEFLYRGFLMDRLTSLTGHAPIAVLISSAAFGLSHLYQGGPAECGPA